jgi:hypothetical protein
VLYLSGLYPSGGWRTNTTSVRRMLDGCQPRWPVPRLVAKVLSRALHHEISVTECGFADPAAAVPDETVTSPQPHAVRRPCGAAKNAEGPVLPA